MDGLEDCCCDQEPCNASVSSARVAVHVWLDQRTNPPYPCNFATRFHVVMRDNLDNSILASWDLKSTVDMAGFGDYPLGRYRVENFTGGPPVVGHFGVFNRNDWVFSDAITPDEVVASAAALAAMVNWDDLPFGFYQDVRYNSGIPEISQPKDLMGGRPNGISFVNVCANDVSRKYLVGEIINQQEFPLASNPGSTSNFGNISNSQIVAGSSIVRFRTPGEWCKRIIDADTAVRDGNFDIDGPGRCGIFATLQGPRDETQLTGGTFILSPSLLNTTTAVKCSACA